MCAINKGLKIVPGTSEVYVSGVILTLSEFLLLLHIADKMGISTNTTFYLFVNRQKNLKASPIFALTCNFDGILYLSIKIAHGLH